MIIFWTTKYKLLVRVSRNTERENPFRLSFSKFMCKGLNCHLHRLRKPHFHHNNTKGRTVHHLFLCGPNGQWLSISATCYNDQDQKKLDSTLETWVYPVKWWSQLHCVSFPVTKPKPKLNSNNGLNLKPFNFGRPKRNGWLGWQLWIGEDWVILFSGCTKLK